MSGRTEYVFDAAVNVSERERLRALEAIFDGATRELLASTVDLQGRRVLEIGAGAGSIARWLAEQVGPSGQVVALDINTRFLDDLPGVEVIEGSILDAALPQFDLVHARYVAIHNTEGARFLNAVVNHVAPGGWVVLEEPDFRAARSLAGPADLCSAFDRVQRAIVQMFMARDMDPGTGVELAARLEALVELATVKLTPHVERGGSPLSRMMWLSTQALAEKYIATGCADTSDITRYEEFSRSPECWALYYATGSVSGRRRP